MPVGSSSSRPTRFMLTTRVGGSGIAQPGALDVPRRRVAHRVAAAAHAELAADGRQRQHRQRGAAAVAIALEPPAALDQRRAGAGVEPRDALDVGGAHAAHLGGALERPRQRALAQPLGAGGVRGEERPSAAPLSNRWRWRASATTRSVPGRERPGGGRPAAPPAWPRGSTTTSVAPRVARLLEVRHQVDAGGRRVDAPQQDDQPRLGVVLVDRPTPSCRRAPGWRRRWARRTPCAASRDAPRRRNNSASALSCVK